jgi:hypothetical protein
LSCYVSVGFLFLFAFFFPLSHVQEMKIQEDQMQVLLSEMSIMRTCADPCVVEFIGAYRKNAKLLWVVIELYDCIFCRLFSSFIPIYSSYYRIIPTHLVLLCF